MKHVFKTAEVAHVWAQQNQEEGRNAQGNFYFQGKTIYSYGRHFPIASFVAPGVVLLTTRGYSPTTLRHIRHVRDAIRHLKVFEGYEVADTRGSIYHDANLKRFIDAFPVQQKKAVKSRKYGEQERVKLSADIKKAIEYAEYFKEGITKETRAALKKWATAEKSGTLFSEKELAKIKAIIKEETSAAKVRNAERRAIDAARLAERQRTQEENLARWLAGEWVNTYSLPTDSVRLRIADDEIQTSRGASVPLIEARKLWDALSKNETVEDMRIGHYTVNRIEESDLIVGCHAIPLKEVYRMAKNLNWL